MGGHLTQSDPPTPPLLSRSVFPMEALERRLSSLSVSSRCAPSDPAYLLDLCAAPPPGDAVAVACSDFTLRLHDKRSLRRLRTLAGHTGPVSAVRFAHRSVSSFYSASLDGTVRLWDVRSPRPNRRSFDLSCSDSLLCGGTEQVNGEDSFLVFWDVRKPGGVLLGVYSESHSDDITQVRFHPTDKDRLASGSTDGLVNVFDLSEGAEDEALVGTCNSESSVSASAGLGAAALDLKSLDTEDELTVYSTRDARVAEGQGSVSMAEGRLCAGLPDRRLLVRLRGAGVGGGRQRRGDVHLFTCDRAGLSPVRTLTSGHTATVRCFGFDSQSLSLFTGGEDGQLLRWSREETGSGQLVNFRQSTLKKMPWNGLKAVITTCKLRDVHSAKSSDTR
uniref:WD repeat-containing protein 89 n=1 Tax=Neogobius melanostomus TaxID=47308 RepID=A0A8C6S5H4_9GOBI